MVLDFLAVDNFDFTIKSVKKIWSEKLVKTFLLLFKQFLDIVISNIPKLIKVR